MKKNRYKSHLGWIIFFQFLMFASEYEICFKLENEIGSENVFLYTVISFLIINIIMMLIPFTGYIINKKRLPKKLGNTICILNSIGLFIISAILSAFFELGFIGGLGALEYYFINKWLFVDYLELLYNNKKANNSINKIVHEYKCSNCGYEFDGELEKCPNCDAEFEDEDNIKESKKNNKEDRVIDKYEDLIKLKELLDKGIITKKEFDAKKKEILNIKE